MVSNPDPGFWQGKRVFLTGHTGFKGAWLGLWLSGMGARVYGYALAPPTEPSLYDVAKVAEVLAGDVIGDIRDGDALGRAMNAAAPDVVIHMAAQPLVRLSYERPLETLAVNVLGTANVLEAARDVDTVRSFVSVTTDKCYDNKEWLWAYRENEPLGGRDPYSASKGCAEIVTAAWRDSFHADGRPWIASARAGNVIGGGDWASDRILPDILRAVDARMPVIIRHPGATRPWQHVLEPLSGYLLLAERLYTEGAVATGAWNFGPADTDARPVSWILDHIRALLPELRWHVEDVSGVHEARFLKLDSSKAQAILRWAPRWALPTALRHTAEWHMAWRGGADMTSFTRDQIADYVETRPDA